MQSPAQQQQPPPIKCLTVLSIIACVMALATVATIVATKNYGIGVDYQTAALCTGYHTVKFSNQKQFYSASAAAALISLIVLTITMVMHLRACCCQKGPNRIYDQAPKLWTDNESKLYYFMYSLALLCITVVLGTYMSLLIERYIKCESTVNLESMLLSIAGFIELVCTFPCWIIALKQCPRDSREESEKLELQSRSQNAKNAYQREVEQFYSTVKKMDENNRQEKLLFENTPIPLVQEIIQQAEDPAIQRESIRAALKKQALLTLKKEKKKQEIQMKKMRFRQLSSMSRAEVQAKRDTKNDNERQDDFRLQGMDKNFGQLLQEAKRPKRMPQPTTLLLSDEPKGPNILSVFATSLPQQLTPDQEKRQRLNKRAMQHIASLVKSKIKTENQNLSEKENEQEVSFKEKPEEKKESTVSPNLFSDLFGLKSAERIQQPEKSIHERQIIVENQLGQSRQLHDSPNTAKFDPPSELMSHAILQPKQKLGEIQERGSSVDGDYEELFFHRPKFGHGNGNRKKRELFDNDIIEPQAFDLEGKEVTIINKLKGNRKIVVGGKTPQNALPESGLAQGKKNKSKAKSSEKVLMESLKSRYRQPQTPKSVENPFASLLMQ